MRRGIWRISFILVVFALASCAPPIGALRVSPGGTADTLWQVPRRTTYDITPPNNRFMPSEDLLVFVSYKGVVNTVPITDVTIELCENPNAAVRVFEEIPNPEPGAANGYHRFDDKDKGRRYLARVFYKGMYSDPYSIQVGSLANGSGGGDWGDEEGIQLLWNPLVTFNSNGGSAVPKQRIVYGAKALVPDPAPEKAGYNSVTWYSDPDLTIPYDFDLAVTANITLYAKWNP